MAEVSVKEMKWFSSTLFIFIGIIGVYGGYQAGRKAKAKQVESLLNEVKNAPTNERRGDLFLEKYPSLIGS